MKTMCRSGFGSGSGLVKSITEQVRFAHQAPGYVTEKLAVNRFLFQRARNQEFGI